MKIPKRLKQSVLCLSLFFFLLSSCQDRHSKEEKKTSTLHFSMHRDMTTLDPRKASDLATATVHFLLFEGLTRLRPDGVMEPAQAKSITVSSDGLRYTFVLRDDLFWSDGSKITAYDYERSWKALLSPEFPSSNAHLLYPIANAEAAKKGIVPIERVGVHAIDEHILTVELQKQAPYFLEIAGFSSFHPVKEDINPSNPKQLIVNGPYLLKEWKFNSNIVLEKNPHYWDKQSVKSDKIVISIIDNENTALSMFEKKQLDFIGGQLAPIPLAAVQKVVKDKRFKVQPVAGSTVCFFNNRIFPFHNENMRKAFAYAILRNEIVKNITQLGETPATTVIPPILKKVKTNVFFEEGNAELARRYLAKALSELNIKASDLNGITYIYSNKQEHHQIAQVLQQQWKEVLGVNVAIQSLEHKTLLDRLSTKNFCFGQQIWLAQFNDPLAILERFKDSSNAKNYSCWEDPLYVTLLEQSYHITDVRRRHLILEEAEKIMLEEMPFVPLYHWSYAFLIQENLKNVCFSSIGSIHIPDIVVEDEKAARPMTKAYMLSSKP